MKNEETNDLNFLVLYGGGMFLWCSILIEVFVSWGGERGSISFVMIGLYILGFSIYYYEKHQRYLNKRSIIEEGSESNRAELVLRLNKEIGDHNNKFALIYLILAICCIGLGFYFKS